LRNDNFRAKYCATTISAQNIAQRQFPRKILRGYNFLHMIIGFDARPLQDRYYSGVAEYTAALARALLQLDRTNKYIFFYNSFLSSDFGWPGAGYANAGQIRGRWPNKLLHYGFWPLLGRPRLDRKTGADVFFAPHINFLRLSKKTKLVLTVHDLSFCRFPEFFSRRQNFWHRAINLPRLLGRADRIVAISQSTKNDLRELFNVPEQKIRVIYSGLDYPPDSQPPASREDDDGFRRRLGLPKKYLLYLGTIEPRKNIANLLVAFNIFRQQRDGRDYDLVLAGRFGFGSQKIISAWRRNPARDRIKFLGYVRPADKAGLYRLADLFVYPSRYEGFGFPPLEAMAAGTPVLTSPNSSLPEVCGEAAWYADPDSPEDLAAGLTAVLSDPGLASTLRAKGFAQAARFSWSVAACSYRSLFQEVAD